MTATRMNVNAVIDQAKFKPFHLTVVLWCLFVVLFDGYDLAINGVALPLLMKEWGMTAVQAGMLASTALAGMMFDAKPPAKVNPLNNVTQIIMTFLRPILSASIPNSIAPNIIPARAVLASIPA